MLHALFNILPCLNFLFIFRILHMLTFRNTDTAFRSQVESFGFARVRFLKYDHLFLQEALIVRTKHYQQKRLASAPKNFHFSWLS